MAELAEAIDGAELTEWMAFFDLEPFGDVRADVRSAIVAQTIANVNRSKGQPAFEVEDFMPQFETRAQTPEEEYALFLLAVGDRMAGGG